jgi:hypothetical protein
MQNLIFMFEGHEQDCIFGTGPFFAPAAAGRDATSRA